MKKLKTRITQRTVMPKGESIYAESSTIATIEDEGGGEFVVVTNGVGERLSIEPKEWKPIRNAIDRLVAAIDRNKKPDDG